MSLRVYNTLSREKEPFHPLREGRVGIYLCGPTVYKPPHIGHLVGPVIFDAVKRYLVFKGYAVNWVVNITDVDDKIIAEAERRGMTIPQLTEEQTDLYLAVLARLGVRDSIDHFPRASQHMPDIVTMIEQLIAKGHAYATDGGDVWFDTASDTDYGKLSNRRLADQEAGQRDLAGGGKKAPADFALWKAVKPGEPSWPSPWGDGRPGWHIECSAMSAKYLGDSFDIHGGGDDLKFPHHENEMAQSECAHGERFVKYWMHNGLTKIKTKAASGEWKSEKMSKSLGNTIDATALLDAHGPDVIRYLLLSTHYRSPIEFDDDVLRNSRKAVETFQRLSQQAETLAAGGDVDGDVDAETAARAAEISAEFVVAMDDDFNTGAAIGALHKLANLARPLTVEPGPENKATLVHVVRILEKRLALLGITLAETKAPETLDDGLVGPLQSLVRRLSPDATVADSADALMARVIELRAAARSRKDFATSDAVRDGLAGLKITLEDKKDGTVWRQE